MFVYNYPDSNIETKIVIFGAKGNIIVCNWRPSIRQWVDDSQPITMGTISYLEHDCRINQGAVHWCYYSEFVRFMNRQQNLNIKEEI